MRASELLGREVVDNAGAPLGRVRDLHLARDGRPSRSGGRPAVRLQALVTGDGALAHEWGYASGAATGPWPLPAVMRRLAGEARWIPADTVVDWAAAPLRLRIRADAVPHLSEVGDEEGRR